MNASYPFLKNELKAIRESVRSDFGKKIKNENDITKVTLLKLQKTELLKIIDNIEADYKEISFYGGVKNLINEAKKSITNDLF